LANTEESSAMDRKNTSAHSEEEKPAKWLNTKERQALAYVAGFVGVLSGVAQFLASYAHSGLQLLGYSAAVVVAGLMIIFAAMRGWRAGDRNLSLRLNLTVLAAVILIVLGGVGGVIGRSLGVWAKPTPTPECDYQPGKPGVVAVKSEAAAPQNLTVCPALLNNGLPLTGPFTVAGRFVGPVEDYQDLVVVGRADQKHCDMYGNRPDPGFYYQSSFRIDSSGRWSFRDSVGYAEAVTIARDYQLVDGPPEVLAAIRSDRTTFAEEHSGDDVYTGMKALPTGARVLASFRQPPGTYNGKGPAPCKGD
jgi:hypothetical protein